MSDKKTDIWMPLYIGEYMADTMTFTTEQHGAYLLLLMACWREKGVLPTDDESLAAITKMPLPRWRASKDKILAKFVIGAEGTMTQKRSMRELERASKVSAARSKAGKAGADRRWHNDSKAMANAMANGVADASQSDAQSQSQSQVTDPSRNTTRDPRGSLVGVDGQSSTKAGAICRAIKAKGVVMGVNPSHPELLALIEKGVPVETFEAAAIICADASPPKGMPYLLGIVKRQLGEAAAIASGVAMPEKPWDQSRATIEAKGVELGIGKWNEGDLTPDRETFFAYTARVRALLEKETA